MNLNSGKQQMKTVCQTNGSNTLKKKVASLKKTTPDLSLQSSTFILMAELLQVLLSKIPILHQQPAGLFPNLSLLACTVVLSTIAEKMNLSNCPASVAKVAVPQLHYCAFQLSAD